MHLNWKNRNMSFNAKELARNEQMDRRFMFMKIFLGTEGCLPLPRGNIHVYDHNIETFSLKLLG